MSSGVITWWSALIAIAVLNIAVWSVSIRALGRRQASLPPEIFAERRLQLILSAFYVFGCAWRSFLPIFDIPRIVVVDSPLSSVMIGRSVATVAELCFAGQWALMLRELARASGSPVARAVSLSIVPLIGIAEICSWYAVLTTWNLAHVFENSLWGICAVLVVPTMAIVGGRCHSVPQSVLVTWCVAGAAYVAFIFVADVPMYWARWLADEAVGREYLSVAQGLLDAAQRRVVSHQWDDWKHEVGWMTLYFSVGVWISISLIHTPPPRLYRAAARVMIHP